MIEVKIDSLLDFKEHMLNKYKDIKNYSLLEKEINSFSLTDLEKGLENMNCRMKRFEWFVLAFKDREEQEIISFYDEYLEYIK